MVYHIYISHWPVLHDPSPLLIDICDGRGRISRFYGPPYEFDGWDVSDVGILHDNLIGPHASSLHAGQVVNVLPHHPDYDFVHHAFNGGING